MWKSLYMKNKEGFHILCFFNQSKFEINVERGIFTFDHSVNRPEVKHVPKKSEVYISILFILKNCQSKIRHLQHNPMQFTQR